MDLNKFKIYKHNYFIFELLFAEECDMYTVSHELYLFLLNTYNQKEIDKKTIGITLYEQDHIKTKLFIDDFKGGISLFPITRKMAIKRLNELSIYAETDEEEYKITNIIIRAEWDKYEGSEYLGFEIHDNTKTKIRRKFEEFYEKFYYSRIYIWCFNTYNRIFNPRQKSRTGWYFRD